MPDGYEYRSKYKESLSAVAEGAKSVDFALSIPELITTSKVASCVEILELMEENIKAVKATLKASPNPSLN